jgi:hypothetical protein
LFGSCPRAPVHNPYFFSNYYVCLRINKFWGGRFTPSDVVLIRNKTFFIKIWISQWYWKDQDVQEGGWIGLF